MTNKVTSIEVIGSGCASCKKLHELAILAAKDLNIEVEVGYSNDIQKALAMGVMQFPVLAINGKAVITGMADIEKIKIALCSQKGGDDQSDCCSCGGDCGCL
ncbi:MAG: thioredoxin family protein [Candidatus Paceibacterota bacterium]|jgi:glutaredoxin